MATVYERSVGATGRDYSTVAAALAAIDSFVGSDDLVSEDAQVDLLLHDDADFTERVTVSGFTCDDTRFIRIVAEDGKGHDGTLDTGVHFEPTSGSGHIFTVSQSHLRLERLELQQYSGAGTSDEDIRITSGVVGVRIEKCLLDRLGAATQQDGVYVGNWSVGSSSFPILVRDCVFTGWNRAGIHAQSFDGGTVTAQFFDVVNCTFGNNSYGIGHALANASSTLDYRIVNCVLGDSATNDYGATGSVNGTITTTGSANNFDEQNQTPAVTVAAWTTNVDPGAGSFAIFAALYTDLRPVDDEDNVLIDAGVGTSNALVSSTDAVGTARGSTTSTVGAFEIAAAGDVEADSALTVPAVTSAGTVELDLAVAAAPVCPAVTASGTGTTVGELAADAALATPAVTSAATGEIEAAASAALTLGAVSTSADGDLTIAGAGSLGLPSVTASGTAAMESEAVNASASLTTPAVTASAAGSLEAHASGALTVPAVAASGAATVEVGSSSALSAPAVTAAGSAAMESDERSVSALLATPAVAASGTASVDVQGAASATAPSVTASGSAGISVGAAAAIAAPAVASSGTALMVAPGAAAELTAPAVTGAGSGQLDVGATASLSAAGVTASAAGQVDLEAGAAAIVPSVTAAASIAFQPDYGPAGAITATRLSLLATTASRLGATATMAERLSVHVSSASRLA